MVYLDVPLITDWMQGCAAVISIPAAIWAIVSLFKRDAKHQEIIETQNKNIQILSQSLTEYQKQTSEFKAQTTSLSLQTNVLAEQTSELAAQTMIAKESNDIHSKYYEEMLKHLTQQSTDTRRLQELEDTKYKQAIKPRFTGAASYGGMSGDMNYRITNRGKTAFNIYLEMLPDSEIKFNIEEPIARIESDTTIPLNGNAGGHIPNTLPYKFNLFFQDEIGTKYVQKVIRERYTHDKISLPIEVAEEK